MNPHYFNDWTRHRFGASGQLLVLGYAKVTIDPCRRWRIRCESCGREKIMLHASCCVGAAFAAVGAIEAIPKE